jgi:hypothetical protein
MAEKRKKAAENFVPIAGRCRFEGANASYLGPTDHDNPFGLCLVPRRFRSGTITVEATLSHTTQMARVVIGYHAATGAYYAVGLGGFDYAYVIVEFIPGRGWNGVKVDGSSSQLRLERPYHLEVEVSGQHVLLSVDSVQVVDFTLPSPLQGDQTGLYAGGTSEIQFQNFRVSTDDPSIFVVMQFGAPYDALYQEVIQPVSHRAGFKALRADHVYRPGVILQDIIRGIVESDVIVADITPTNPNVFYELGYAHALQKPTILLANRQIEKLPFDVSGYRVIFYDDTIGGKRDIESTLEKHLESIRRGRA